METNYDTWDHFKKCDDSEKRKAMCRHCHKIYSYSSTTGNLKAHLKVHDIYLPRRPPRKKTQYSSKERRLYRKLFWENFVNKDVEDKSTQCKYCQKHLSFRSTTGNLKRHLYAVHREVHDRFEYNLNEQLKTIGERPVGIESDHDWSEDDEENEVDSRQSESSANDDEDQCSDEEAKHSTPDGDVSAYFEREAGGRARCAVCRTSVTHVAAVMRAHLRDYHPKLLPAGQELENQDGEDEIYTEVVYLEENLQSEEKRKSPKKRVIRDRKSGRWQAAPPYSDVNIPLSGLNDSKKRKTSTPPPEIKKKNPEDEEIESFGAYITCLLKSLPKDVCSAIQRDIITLIVNAKLTKPQQHQTDEMPVRKTQGKQSYIVIDSDQSNKDDSKVQYSIKVATIGDEKIGEEPGAVDTNL